MSEPELPPEVPPEDGPRGDPPVTPGRRARSGSAEERARRTPQPGGRSEEPPLPTGFEEVTGFIQRPLELQAGARFLKRYTLQRELGRGGMGVVWLAEDGQLGESVALKFLPPEIRADAAAVDDLRRETSRSHKLTHPNIVRIHDFHQVEGGAAFVSMEYVEGPNLSALRVRNPGRVLTWDYLAPLVQQLCAALEYAHEEKVIHRDLKPANLMLDGRGRLKLADFGIAAVMSDSMSRVSMKKASGTLAYMSPQQLEGQPARVTDDIYALGATLYELLTSKPPYHAGDVVHQVLHVAPLRMEERLVEYGLTNLIPPAAAAMVMACLSKDPLQRPQTARAIAEWAGLSEAWSLPTAHGGATAEWPTPLHRAQPGEPGRKAPIPPTEHERTPSPAQKARSLSLAPGSPKPARPPTSRPESPRALTPRPTPLAPVGAASSPAGSGPAALGSLAPGDRAAPVTPGKPAQTPGTSEPGASQPVELPHALKLAPTPPKPSRHAATAKPAVEIAIPKVPEPPPPAPPEPHAPLALAPRLEPEASAPPPTSPEADTAPERAAEGSALPPAESAAETVVPPSPNVVPLPEPRMSRWKLAVRVAVAGLLLVLSGAVVIFVIGMRPPVIYVQPSAQAAEIGASIVLRVRATSLARANYQWYFRGDRLTGATQEVYAITNVQSRHLGAYFVVVSNRWGTVTSEIAPLTVKVPPPEITQEPADVTRDAGGTANFAVNAQGDPPLRFQWFHNNVPLPGATNRAWGLSGVVASQAGEVFAVISNLGGSVTSRVASLLVRVAPLIAVQPKDQTAVEGARVELRVEPSGIGPFEYEWTHDGKSVRGGGEKVLLLPVVDTSMAGTYKVLVRNSAGAVVSDTARLIVKIEGVRVAREPVDQRTDQGTTVVFSVEARGEGLLQYQWYHDTVPMPGQTNAELRLASVEAQHAGKYYVAVSTGTATTSSRSAQLTVTPRTAARVLVEPTGQTVTEGASVTFEPRVAGTAPLTYQWYFRGAPLGGATNERLSFSLVTPNRRGDYYLVAANALGSATSRVARLEVNAIVLEIVQQPQPANVEEGGDAAFEVQARGIEPMAYQWQFKGLKIPGATNKVIRLTGVTLSQAGQYNVVVKNAEKTVTSQFASLSVSQSAQLSWMNSLGMKFVSVPGTRAWFAIWETRVQDFAAFARARPREWSKPAWQDTHPAVNVTWVDAREFCQWLTEKEFVERRLPQGRSYRLPTDLEWSSAADFAGEAEKTPQDRHARGERDHGQAYPWGTQWPPPTGAGNYADQAAKRRHPDWVVIEGYDDGFPETAPVGSFRPNRFGLHDLGGNVWEWCDDVWSPQTNEPVLRGASYYNYVPDTLRVWYRLHQPSLERSAYCGFRVVLAPSR